MKSFKHKNPCQILSLILFLLITFSTQSQNSKTKDSKLQLLKSSIQQAKLFPDSVLTENDFMGVSVAMDANRALVGATKLSGFGVVYVFDYVAGVWQQSAILEPIGVRQADSFGQSVSLKGNVALIGAPKNGENGTDSGAAYIFELELGDWVQKAELFANDGEDGQNFGWSVSLESDFALIGSKYDFTLTESGSAYLFEYSAQGDSWSQASKLTPQGGVQGNGFGQSVSINGTLALVAAVSDSNINGNSSGAVYTYKWNGFNWVFDTKLIASDGDDFDFFGISLSLNNNRALIGARNDDNNGFNQSGSAYVFDYDGTNWAQTTKLVASDESTNAYFGSSVSIIGDLALVGALSAASINSSNPGAVYLFELTAGSWSQIQRFNATDDSPNDSFGEAVALGVDKFIVGNSKDDDNGDNAGAAYVYDNSSGWQQQKKLLSSLGPNLDSFATAVSIDGNRAVVGAPENDDAGIDAGSVYVFDYASGAWSLTQQIYASDASSLDWFGAAVSLSGDRLIIGAPLEDSEGTNAGAVYVFDLIAENWTQTDKLIVNSLNAHDRFGTSVSLSTERLLIGAYGVDLDGVNKGAAYVFDLVAGNWIYTTELKASDGANLDSFAETVSLDGDRALISSHRDDDGGSDSGSAYIFELDNGSWSETTKLTAGVDSSSNAFFGKALSLSGNTVLIGANGETNNKGAAYIFEYNSQSQSWDLIQRLTALDSQVGDYFGISLAIEDNIAVIGASGDDNNGTDSGSASIFQKINNSWTLTETIQADDGMAEHEFGKAIALSSQLALIGAPLANAQGLASGAAYVFDVDILPVAEDDTVSTNEDTLLEIFPMTNDTDLDGGTNSIISVSNPANGNVYLNSPKITYIPLANYCNDGITTDDFTYTINGGSTANVHVQVDCVEEIPVAVDDSYTIDEDVDTSLNVLENDYDVDSDPNTISIISVTQPANGLVENFSTSLVYKPNAEYCNDGVTTDDFTYELNGGWIATVEMTVTCVDDIAIAENDLVSINEDQTILIDVLSNDVDIDAGPAFEVVQFSQPQFGVVSNESGELRYVPNQDYCNDGVNIDDFTYTITGGNSATVNVTVFCVNDQPDFNHLGDISTSMLGGFSITGWAFDFDFGSENENFFQQVAGFNLNIVSDSNMVIEAASLDISLDGDLSFTTTGNIGTAIIEISMQDNGGTSLGGEDTSETKSFTISFVDTIFASGFESNDVLPFQAYLTKLAQLSLDIEVPRLNLNNNSISFYQFEYYLQSEFFTKASIQSLQSWLTEILILMNPNGDFDLDGIENELDYEIKFN